MNLEWLEPKGIADAAQPGDSASRQLDFVFASKALKDCVSVRAINELTSGGRHCRVEIKIE